MDLPTAPDRVTALLRSPLGILTVLRLAKLTGDAGVAELSAAQLYDLVIESVVVLSPHSADYHDRARSLLARGPSLRREAEQLMASPAAGWFAPLDRSGQVWISRDGRPPGDAVAYAPDPRQFGGGTPKPRAALWTSTTVGAHPGGWIPYLRGGEDGRPPPYHPFRLTVEPAARVYEVQGPEEWHDLCAAFPASALENGVVIPDWAAVARRYDGVHLSAGGLLTAQEVAWASAGRRTRLTGWDVECTVWLRWAFSRVDSLPSVES